MAACLVWLCQIASMGTSRGSEELKDRLSATELTADSAAKQRVLEGDVDWG